MERKKVTMKNDFHNTEATVYCQYDAQRNTGYLSPRQYSRALKKLCGMADCECGGVRGRQDYYCEDEMPDGTLRIRFEE